MAKNCKFELNKAGLIELMQGAEMRSVLSDYGRRTVQRAGAGDYESITKISGDRAACVVRPTTQKARNDCLKNNTLLKVVGAG